MNRSEMSVATASSYSRTSARGHADVFHKTRLCKFLTGGLCRHGRSCTYAHSVDELRDMPIFFKTSMCWQLKQMGRCSKGSACTFAHAMDELRPFWPQGCGPRDHVWDAGWAAGYAHDTMRREQEIEEEKPMYSVVLAMTMAQKCVRELTASLRRLETAFDLGGGEGSGSNDQRRGAPPTGGMYASEIAPLRAHCEVEENSRISCVCALAGQILFKLMETLWGTFR